MQRPLWSIKPSGEGDSFVEILNLHKPALLKKNTEKNRNSLAVLHQDTFFWYVKIAGRLYYMAHDLTTAPVRAGAAQRNLELSQ